MRLAWSLGVVCVVSCFHGAPDRVRAEEASPAAEPNAEQIQLWISELTDDAYPVRLSAAEQLLSAGTSARGPLLKLVDCPEPEARAAARRLVALIDRTEFQRRLAAFAADSDGSLGLTMPGWDLFREQIGEDPIARGLFVEIQRHEGTLLSSSFGDSQQSLDDQWEARLHRIVQWQSTVALGNEPPSLGSCAAMVFLGAAAQFDVSDRGTVLVENLIQQPPMREQMQAGQYRDAIRRLVVAWICNCPNRNQELLKHRFALASANELHEVVPWALSVAAGKGDSARLQPATRATAILLVGQLGQPEHIAALEPLLTDSAVCSAVGPGQPDANVQICDVALVVMLHLSGQRPADYGYIDARLQPQLMYQFQTFSVEGGRQRAEAIAKWRAWRADQRRDTEVVPAEFREEDSGKVDR
jgi:hypothetical protein